jgi:hypothetical protein
MGCASRLVRTPPRVSTASLETGERRLRRHAYVLGPVRKLTLNKECVCRGGAVLLGSALRASPPRLASALGLLDALLVIGRF